jgi:hypothetical protein
MIRFLVHHTTAARNQADGIALGSETVAEFEKWCSSFKFSCDSDVTGVLTYA